jgi:multiple sugar transport system ATP-binding protein
MADIELDGLVKRFGKVTAVHGIDLKIADGEFVVLVGPSGCGKSTTLRMIAGLEDITAGTLRIGGEVVNEREPKQRNIAMVFQNYAIYPHLTVAQNIGFGLYTAKLSKEDKHKRIARAADILGLDDLLERRPSALSGGQRQRVAIGRAMVRDPVAFLFDEPLSNLDAQLRAQMRIEIKQLHQRLGTTVVYVTHDQVEAMTMADRIVVMRDGKILQEGTPVDLYEKPVDVFTARFIGSPSMNLVSGRVSDGKLVLTGGTSGVAANGLDLPVDRNLLVGVRPHDLVTGTEAIEAAVTITGKVSVVEPLGAETLVHLTVPGGSVIATAPGKVIPLVGRTLSAHAEISSLHFFDAGTEKALPRP